MQKSSMLVKVCYLCNGLILISIFISIAIDTLLRSSALHAGDATDRVIVADVTEHWVSFLENQLQDAGSGESMVRA